jgi:anaerobic selenocysteine-containing dehydrogenase
VVYEDEDIYRGQDRRDVILMHPDDIASHGLRENQRVTVRSSAGAMRGILIRPFANIRQGNCLMYYPEANVLVPAEVDAESKTPAFKSVAVTVSADAIAAPADAVGRRQLARV